MTASGYLGAPGAAPPLLDARPTLGRRRLAVIVAVMALAIAAVGAFAAGAYATTLNITPPASIAHGQIWSADTSYAQQTVWVTGSSDHTFCPAITQGVRGWSQGYSYISYGACGPGYQQQDWCGCGGFYTRGGAYNSTSTWYDALSSLNWIW